MVCADCGRFFPAIGVLLGWPLLAKRLLDSGANYEIPESMRLGYGWE